MQKPLQLDSHYKVVVDKKTIQIVLPRNFYRVFKKKSYREIRQLSIFSKLFRMNNKKKLYPNINIKVKPSITIEQVKTSKIAVLERQAPVRKFIINDNATGAIHNGFNS